MHYVSFKTRICAFLLDYLLILLYGIFVVGTISIVFRPMVLPLFSNTPALAQLTGFFLITLPVSLYFALCECSRWQGTIGKKVLRIKVADHEGRRIHIGRSIVRTAIKFLPWEIAHFAIWHLVLPSQLSEMIIYLFLSLVNIALILYVIVPFTNKRRKNIYDWVARTIVIH